jgi:hypothetical protein
VSLQANPSAIPLPIALPMVSSTEVTDWRQRVATLRAALTAITARRPPAKPRWVRDRIRRLAARSRAALVRLNACSLNAKSAPNSRFEVFWRSLNES